MGDERRLLLAEVIATQLFLNEQAEPDGQAQDNRGPEPRTTASDGRCCQSCGRPLTGRKERFCSDRCRMRDRREREQARVDELLRRLKDDVDALREELVGEVD